MQLRYGQSSEEDKERPELRAAPALSLFCRKGFGGSAGIADEVRQTDPSVAVAQQCESAERGDALIELLHAHQVTNGVLRQAAGPAANAGERSVWRWQRAKDLLELCEGEFGNFAVEFGGEGLSAAAAEEDAQDASAGGRAVRKLLVDEGASEQRGV